MKSVIIGLIIVILSFLFLLFGLPLINKNSDDCDGFFHHNYCIDQNTSNKTLIKLGLKEEKINETYELRIEYPKIIIKYPKLFEHLKEQAQQIKTDMDYLNTYDSNNKNSIPRSLTILCEESSDFVKFLSVVCRFTEYTEGGNPKHGFFTTNFDIEYKDIVDLEDIFNKDSKALEEISDYVIMQIYKEKSERSGELVAKDDVIERGASPERG
nr:hypothetical protein [Candidatus Dadabacteria bacterium]NIQ16193.1 hypothetical protein [Candidatus Dadabacteria bacterium]